MNVTAEQEAAFTNSTLGVPMDSFELVILLVLFGLLYLWAGWVLFTQWKAFDRRKISLHDLIVRTVRVALITILVSFLLR
jgi:integrating conjugative element protein (TIGR03758 family)